ncbi:MAG: MerR family DNA-binding protein [Oleibacter sp.]|nr:MerR family DNA-binding protein [Thalassolituus sp.]
MSSTLMKDSSHIKDISKKYAISADTLRHYLRIGLLSPQKDTSGYHQFAKQDEKVLRFILDARELGFTLQDIRQLITDSEQGHSPCPNARQLIELRLSQSRKKLASLQALVNRMEKATESWKTLPDCEPCGAHICHLIEGALHEPS